MNEDFDRVLISQEQIAHRVREMARQITADHSGNGEITIVPILTGAMIFCADLMRNMPIAMKIGLMTVSSYPGKSVQSQGVKVFGQSVPHVAGRHVLLVDDILDSGQTLAAVTPMLRQLGAASVKTCVLLRKDRPTARQTPADYVGFDIPDEFVVGYGLDVAGRYRNLPFIGVVKNPEIA